MVLKIYTLIFQLCPFYKSAVLISALGKSPGLCISYPGTAPSLPITALALFLITWKVGVKIMGQP